MPTPASTPANKEVVDPVCGMTIEPGREEEKIDWNGRTYYFCTSQCAAKFRKEH